MLSKETNGRCTSGKETITRSTQTDQWNEWAKSLWDKMPEARVELARGCPRRILSPIP